MKTTIKKFKPIAILRKRNRVMREAFRRHGRLQITMGFEVLEEDYPELAGYYAVYPKKGRLCCGTVCNAGAFLDASIEYDVDSSFEENLQELYLELTENV